MPRIRRSRDVQIVHFSFFDLLFGAFGAFIFLMLMHVIRTINFLDVGFQNAFDELVAEKNNLLGELERYKNDAQQRFTLEGQYREALERLNQIEEENRQLAERNKKDKATIDSLRQEVNSLAKIKDEYARKGEIEEALERENEQLKRELDTARQRLATMEPTPLEVKASSLPTMLVGENMNLPIAARGGVPPYRWDYTGRLPDGLSFDRQNGVITGQIRKEGEYTFVAKVTDASGAEASTGEIRLSVAERPQERGGVSPGFVVMSIIASLLLTYVLIKRLQAHLYYKKMIRLGYEPVWVKKG